jgi:predicted negative regulator of RcsB-dependent stress response
LLSAKFFEGQGKTDQARSLLKWVHQHGSEPGLAAAAGLRLAGSYIQTQEIGEAQQLLGSSFPPAFQPLVHERLADVAMLQKQSDKAKELYLKAWKAMPQQSEYRRLVEVKLAALGVEHPLEGDKP